MLEKTEMISERQAAKLMGIHPSTLMHWRKSEIIPFSYESKIYVRGNIRIFYDKMKIVEWGNQLRLTVS
jgi:DNA-binding transcriptional MerR regulator